MLTPQPSPRAWSFARTRRPAPIVLLVIGTSLIRLAFASTTGLGVDESYMITAGRNFSVGYFDHPPASWWLSFGAAHLLGTEAPWAVRLPFILLFALSQILVWRMGCLLADQRSGFWAAVALNLSPVFGVTTGTWVLPDGPLDVALLGMELCLLRALPATGQVATRWWMAAGICAGFALFSKYSAILNIGGAFLYVLFSRQHRYWLARHQPYLAAGLAAALFAPVVVWNATHGWASFAFQGERAAGLQFRAWMPIETWAGEALFVLPWIWAPMMLVFVRGFRTGATWPERLSVCLAAPAIIGFAAVSAWSRQRILYHWAAPGYLMLFPVLGSVISRTNRAWVRAPLFGTIALVLISVTVIATQVQFDWLGDSLSRIARHDPTAEAVDWTSLHDEVAARGLLPPGTVVAAFNWRDAGKIGYAMGPETTMLCLSSDPRQFGLAYPPRNFVGRNVLLFATDSGEPLTLKAQHWFDDVETMQTASVKINGRIVKDITVLRGHGLHAHP